MRRERLSVFFSAALKLSVAGGALIAAASGLWLACFVSLLSLGAMLLPASIARRRDLHLPIELELPLVVLIYASLFLGTAGRFYDVFWWWDAMLHTLWGGALGVIGFLTIYGLYRAEQITTRPGLLALFAFCYSLALGALWEVFEFTSDALFGTTLQFHGLVDTMWDLIVDSIGAGTAALLGYWYVTRHRQGFFARFIGRFVRLNFRR